jgi:tRNA A-37 threonylcarbamoyl transferase component Bud32
MDTAFLGLLLAPLPNLAEVGLMNTGLLLLVLGLCAFALVVILVVGVLYIVLWRSHPARTAAAVATHCPRCHAVLPADAPQGLCPRCLLLRGLGEEESRPFSVPARPAEAKSSPAATAAYRDSLPAPPTAELAGAFPQLDILELLGQGGMGAVYKARQPKLDRLVALKVLPPETGHDAQFAERFLREARALARLDHPHIVGVYDFGEAGGVHYLLMEFVDGVNLRQLMRAGRLAPEQALPIVGQLCEALQYAHEEGVVHRDIKPENILLDKKGRVKIADFGLAKLLSPTAAELALTATHQVMGTLHYMAPEQMEKPLQVDHRADIYSLGVVFYEMLTGELPLGRFSPPSEKAQTDVRLDEVVLRALEREPERRYQSISDVKTAVDSVQALRTTPPALVGDARDVRTASSTTPRTRPPRGKWLLLAWVAFCLGVIVIALVAETLPGPRIVPEVYVALIQSAAVDALLFTALFLGARWGVRASRPVWSNPERRRAALARAVPVLAILLCILGVGTAFLPWSGIRLFGKMEGGSAPDQWHEGTYNALTMYDWHGMACTGTFLGIGLIVLATVILDRGVIGRAIALLAGGGGLLAVAVLYIVLHTRPEHQPRVWQIRSSSAVGPYLVSVLALGLVVLGLIELRGVLVKRSEIERSV